ncbi:MAG: alpha/beta hydrolase [Bryobacteraceae bacterium]
MRLLLAPAFTAAMFAQAPPVTVPEGWKVHRDLAYVTNAPARQRLDLYLPPKTGKLPLVIWIHGGAWIGGDKNNPLPLRLIADQGYAIASLGYRLSSMAKFSAQIEDCKAAVRWLRAHAADYSLDPARFAAWGSSAGGHLVSLLGTAGDKFDIGENIGQSSRVQAVVDYYGPTDFLQMDAHALAAAPFKHDAPDSPESQLVGGPIRENDLAVARANPATYATKDDPPFLIVHGDQDPLVPHHQSEILEEALRKAGVRVRLYTVKGGGHGTGFEKDPAIVPMVKEFLAGVLSR